MPKKPTSKRRVPPERVIKALGRLGWTQSEFLQRLDRCAGTVYAKATGYLWFEGKRDFPDIAIVFLTLSLHLLLQQRRCQRLRARIGQLQPDAPATPTRAIQAQQAPRQKKT